MHVVNVFGGVHGSTSIGPVGIDKKPDLCPFCGLKIDACILQNSFCVDEGGEESLELKQIVGPAYRKALEFLIKDYAISNKGDDEEKIKGMSLTNCIKTYIEDSKAIDCAKRATWIGNDETHYVKEWKDKDINDMKILMEIVINCIENKILHKQYLADMPYK